MKLCSVTGCENIVRAIGLCNKHYIRLKRNGDVDYLGKVPNGYGTVRRGYRYFNIGGMHIAEHVLIAEKAIGKKLPRGAIVHHMDGDKLNNNQKNLVVCPNEKYHQLLHMRIRSLGACGNANHHKCRYCKKFDEPSKMVVYETPQHSAFHASCRNLYQNKRAMIRRASLVVAEAPTIPVGSIK